ncbi:unnamed protein product [Rhizophagus irregularis]|nr:unnamed protein product [Rhizophagus irregularis]
MSTSDFEISETPGSCASGAPYYRGFKAESLIQCLYKIRDDSVRPREFFGADTEDGIEAILRDRGGHSLHEIVDVDKPVRPFIDFDLSGKALNALQPKLAPKEIRESLIRAFTNACEEIYPEWDKNTLTLASSCGMEKMSHHISTYGMRVKSIAQAAAFAELVRKKLPEGLRGQGIIDNIAKKRSFSLRMLGSPKFIEETNKHIREKKAVQPKDGTVYDFMLQPPNDESRVVDSPLLNISEISPMIHHPNNEICETTQVEFELVKKLLEEASIEGYDFSYPSETTPDIFSLNRLSPSYCSLCDREHTSENAYIKRNKKWYRFYCYRANQKRKPGERNPSIKLVLSETALGREKNLPPLVKLGRSRITDPYDHFVWGDLLRMCTSGKKYSRAEVYEAIQATVAYIQDEPELWILKRKDAAKGPYFKFASKLSIEVFKINIFELGGKSVKLRSLIRQATSTGLINYDEINFLPYPPNNPKPDTDFFNLFLGFKAKPATEINKEIMEPILWHVKNVICDGDERLNEYIWNWWAFLVQKPDEKPRTILVLKSALQQCGKNIITDFIGKKVLGPLLYFGTSDLEKVLGKFNSPLQGRRLIVMNEMAMSSSDWHRFYSHLKSLITDGTVAIEYKCKETISINDYSCYMVTSNQDALLKIEAGDMRTVCFDVSQRCRGNKPYFKRLEKILNHPDAPGVFMKYLLSLDISKWDPQTIPSTKMKVDIMMKQLPDPVRFVINHISSWSKDHVDKPICANLYREYLSWCGENGEVGKSNNKFGGYLLPIGIEKKQARIDGKRESLYILDRNKIVAKLRESVGEIEEFSDAPQPDLPDNEVIEIPVFKVPESTPASGAGEVKNTCQSSNTSGSVTDSMSQAQAEIPIASTSGTSAANEPPQTIEPAVVRPESEHVVNPNPGSERTSGKGKEVERAPPQQDSPPMTFHVNPARAQREERLRKWAIDNGEDPDTFMTITEKDFNLSVEYRQRMISDAEVIPFAIENDMNPNEMFYMTRRERLISEEIILRSFEDAGTPRAHIYDDEEWKEAIITLQEYGVLW